MDNLNVKIFDKKTLKDVFRDIYNNQKKKEIQLSILIDELKPLIKNIGDANLIIPLLKEYMEIGIKNDEQLIKMANIVQRCINVSKENPVSLITDEEKEKLIMEINKIEKEIKSTPKTQ